MNKVGDRQNALVKDFQLFDNAMDQYEYIIDLGKEMKPLANQHKTEDNVVQGCQSTVWLHAFLENDKVRFLADSNTVITKGIIALLINVLDNQSPEDIINSELFFIDQIDLRSHLSSQRSNGLNAMVKQMKMYALAFKLKQEQAHHE